MTDAATTILAMAARQHGVVARWQLRPAGVPLHTVDNWLKRGRLQRLHPSVYRLPALVGAHEREVAAVLSCGMAAALSHECSGAVFGLVPPVRGDIEVSAPRGRPRPRPGLRLYRVLLPPDETTQRDGIPITTPARTLLDIAGIVSARALEQALARALRLELTSPAELSRVLQRYPRRAGARQLAALLARDSPPAFVRSEAEERFLTVVRRAQLPPPETNVRVAGFEVDFFWRAEALVVEVDGRAYHASRAAFARDRRRDAVLTAAGLRTMRLTWADLTEHLEATAARVAQALARGRSG